MHSPDGHPIDLATLSAPELASLETLRLGLTRQEVLKTFRAAGAFRVRSDYYLPRPPCPAACSAAPRAG